MHILCIPVVSTKDKNENTINKISASKFWKRRESYKNYKIVFINT